MKATVDRFCLLLESDADAQDRFIDILHSKRTDIGCLALETWQQAWDELNDNPISPVWIAVNVIGLQKINLALIENIRNAEQPRRVRISAFVESLDDSPFLSRMKQLGVDGIYIGNPAYSQEAAISEVLHKMAFTTIL